MTVFDSKETGERTLASRELRVAARHYHMGYANNLPSVANPAFCFLVENKIVPIILKNGELFLKDIS